jgi:2-polyprenyl-3-methyl-5-hydroxy-6-metoxy-1,4-benzoquinol methylase
MKSKEKVIKSTSKELFYDSISDIWAKKINNSETNKRIKVIFNELLSKKDINNKKFLEVGCGLGYFSNKAYKLGANVTGIDIGPKLVSINKKLTPRGKFFVSSASKLPFKDQTFDVVLSTEVIEHVENQKTALREMSRVLKSGGILVITTPNRVFKPLFDFLSWVRIRPYHGNEKWIFSWDLEKMMNVNGLATTKSRYFNFIAPNNFFDKFESLPFLKHLMINYAFVFKKK